MTKGCKSVFQRKVDWLTGIGINPFRSPSYLSGKLEARRMHSFVDDIIDYVIDKHQQTYRKNKHLINWR